MLSSASKTCKTASRWPGGGGASLKCKPNKVWPDGFFGEFFGTKFEDSDSPWPAAGVGEHLGVGYIAYLKSDTTLFLEPFSRSGTLFTAIEPHFYRWGSDCNTAYDQEVMSSNLAGWAFLSYFFLYPSVGCHQIGPLRRWNISAFTFKMKTLMCSLGKNKRLK